MKKQIGRRQLRLLGQRIRAIRLARGFSQEELASRSEIHATYLSSVECGKRNPSLMILFSIAHGLSVPPGALFQFDGVEKSSKYDDSEIRPNKKWQR